MSKKFFCVLASFFFFSFFSCRGHASSQDECAIWLCLPGGFPEGCASAHSAFKDRIEHGKPPLPDLSSCMSGPDGSRSMGKYEMGTEYFVPCKAGFKFDQVRWNAFREGICKPVSSSCDLKNKCQPYYAEKRGSPYYINMWVDGEYLGQFFYK